MSAPDKHGAVLQFEIDRKRWAETDTVHRSGGYADTPDRRLETIAKLAVGDTLRSGGTFVLVVTADKITMVQRPEAEEL